MMVAPTEGFFLFLRDDCPHKGSWDAVLKGFAYPKIQTDFMFGTVTYLCTFGQGYRHKKEMKMRCWVLRSCFSTQVRSQCFLAKTAPKCLFPYPESQATLSQEGKPRDNKKPRRNEENIEKKASIEATISNLTDTKRWHIS